MASRVRLNPQIQPHGSTSSKFSLSFNVCSFTPLRIPSNSFSLYPLFSNDFLHGTFKGEPTITIPREIEASFAARFDTTLIGKISQGKPSLETIQKFLTIQSFKGTILVGLIDKKHALLRSELPEEMKLMRTMDLLQMVLEKLIVKKVDRLI